MEHFEIATVAEQSGDNRRVLWTGRHTQLVIMTIPPDGEIGGEVHEKNDQILSFVSGVGKAVVEGEERHGTAHRTKEEADAAEAAGEDGRRLTRRSSVTGWPALAAWRRPSAEDQRGRGGSTTRIHTARSWS